MKNEVGRTLVELISVLAIIGVLSITGIIAYRYAMIRYQANELIHKANLAYIEIRTKNDTNNWIDISLLQHNAKKLQGYSYNNSAFIWASNIEKEVCERILAEKTNFNLLTTENEMMTSCDELNDIIFDFENIGSMEFTCSNDNDCYENQYCSISKGSCITPENCGLKAFWNQEIDACENCSLNASTAQTDEQLSNSKCYCEDDYKVYNDTCIHSCEYEMVMAGYDSKDYTIIGNTITYNKYMLLDTTLDLTGCDLIVNNVLDIATTGNLTVNNLKTTGGVSILHANYNGSYGYVSTVGVCNFGIINANNITADAGDNHLNLSTVESCSGGFLNYGKVNAATIIATAGESTTSSSVSSCTLGYRTENGSYTIADTLIATAGKSLSERGDSRSWGVLSYGSIQVNNLTAIAGTVATSAGSVSRAGLIIGSTSSVKVNALNYCPSIANYGSITNNGGIYSATLVGGC